MKSFFIVAVLFCSSIFCNSQGINFEEGNWKETVSKAKAEKKLIYLDVFTTWCGPCKMMAKNYFPDKDIASVYNKDFINSSIDAEKGEGIEIAKKYHVNGYPTNLFIDPKTEEIIYKTVGMPEDKSGFIKNAETAIAELNDPMKITDYETKFSKGNYDEKFLTQCIDKYQRLDLNNDKLLNAYTEKYSKNQSIDSNLIYLKSKVTTINNKGFDYIIQHYKKGEVEDKLDYTDHMMYYTIAYAVSTQDKVYFEKSIVKFKQYFPDEIEKELSYHKDFYTKIDDEKLLLTASEKYADFLINKSEEKYKTDDIKMLEESKRGIAMQVKSMNLTDEKLKEFMDKTIQSNPVILRMVSYRASTELNEMAWNVFEKKREDKILLSKALQWSAKSVALGNQDAAGEQLAVKDTYACLLYANGKKDEAIQLEKELVEQATKEKSDDVSSFEETLKKMVDGTL